MQNDGWTKVREWRGGDGLVELGAVLAGQEYDKVYWAKHNANVAQYPEGATTFNYPPDSTVRERHRVDTDQRGRIFDRWGVHRRRFLFSRGTTGLSLIPRRGKPSTRPQTAWGCTTPKNLRRIIFPSVATLRARSRARTSCETL